MKDPFELLEKPRKSRLPRLPDNPDYKATGRFPSWLHRTMPQGKNMFNTEEILRKYGLNTVCEEAKCPNRGSCFTKKTATFLIMGKECSRACGFCDIDFAKTPKDLDPKEPMNVALSTKELGLEHVVITMVARDDLEDQGASHLVLTMQAIRKEAADATIEILTSDYGGNFHALERVLEERPEIFNHNIETIERLTPHVRHKATYQRSLEVLAFAKKNGKASFIKSGIMVGLGESEEEVLSTLQDLANIGVDIVTIGQYLQASPKKIIVKKFITPETFAMYKTMGEKMGIKHVFSGPFVRSSFNAKEVRDIMEGK